MLYRRFDFELDMAPVNPDLLAKQQAKGSTAGDIDESIARVGMKAAATIHTAKGLFCKVKARDMSGVSSSPEREKELA